MGVTSEFTASSVLPLGLPGYLGSILRPRRQAVACSGESRAIWLLGRGGLGQAGTAPFGV